jgi:hypothetical protein
MGSLLEAVHGLFQLVDMSRMMRILEPLGLFYIHLFLKYTIQKGTLNIHPIKLESKMTSNGKQDSDGL